MLPTATRRRRVRNSPATILGVSPLVVAEGAGAAGRQALGTAVFGGMIGGTVFSLLFTPVLVVTVVGLTNSVRRMVKGPDPVPASESQGHVEGENDRPMRDSR